MFSWEKNGDRVAIVQMNAELRHAQLEILSAQCATDRLRLRFSTEGLARHAQRDVLRKALSAANALHHYYSSIARQVTDPDSMATASAHSWNEARVTQAVGKVAHYLHGQREFFRPRGRPLSEDHRRTMTPFFDPALLEKVRFVVLEEGHVPNPPFYAEARAEGFTYLPEFTHLASLTFEDVLVFHRDIPLRTLFHALVHAVQFEILGLARYTELFVRGFLRTRSHISVPLEAHAFSLEVRFVGDPAQAFSVEEKVRLWTNQGRY